MRDAEQEGAPRAKLCSVQEAFDAFCEETSVATSDAGVLLYNDKAWVCEQCQSTRLPNKIHRLENFADCFILHLKRWENVAGALDGPSQVHVINHQVHVNDALQVGEESYVLKSVVRQSGDCNAGHYVATCFCNGSWWYYNDTTRRKLRPEEDTSDATHKSYIAIYDRMQNPGVAPMAV